MSASPDHLAALRFYIALLVEIPGTMWRGFEKVFTLLAILGVVLLLAATSRPSGRAMLNWDVSPWWVLAPVAAYITWGLMKANYLRFRKLEKERDSLKATIRRYEAGRERRVLQGKANELIRGLAGLVGKGSTATHSQYDPYRTERPSSELTELFQKNFYADLLSLIDELPALDITRNVLDRLLSEPVSVDTIQRIMEGLRAAIIDIERKPRMPRPIG